MRSRYTDAKYNGVFYMIPLRIQLKNFLSYGAVQTIDFEPYQLICLSGKNGHGKSALLDAITWALWGQARKISGVAKPDEKLVRLGHMHMFVILDFVSDGQTYRVRREFVYQHNKPHATLDFGLIQSTGHFKPLTDKTIRVTQQKIDQCIGLTYDSFINSVFLRQGAANEFSKKTPQERKELLAALLGLDRYELLRKRAQEEMRACQAKREHYYALVCHVEPEIAKKPQIIELLQQLQVQWKMSLEQEEMVQAQLRQHEDKKIVLLQQQAIKEQLTVQRQQLIQRDVVQREVIRKLIKQWRSIRRSLSGMQAHAHQRKALEIELTVQQQHMHEFVELQQNYYLLQQREQGYKWQWQERVHKGIQDFQQKRQQYQAQLQQAQFVIAEHAKHQKQLQDELNYQQQALQELGGVVTQLEIKERLLREKEQLYKRYCAMQQKCTMLVLRSKNKLQHLQERDHLATAMDNPECALCEQPITEQQKNRVVAKVRLYINAAQSHLHTRERILAHLKEYAGALALLLEELPKLVIEKNQYLSKKEMLLQREQQARQELAQRVQVAAELHKKSEQTHKFLQEIDNAQREFELGLEREQATDEQYRMLVQGLAAIEHKRALNSYNPERLQEIKRQLSIVDEQEKKYRELVHESAGQHERRQRIQDVGKELKDLDRQLKQVEQQLYNQEQIGHALDICIKAEQQARVALQLVITKKEELVARGAELRQQRSMVDKHEQEIIANKHKIKELDETIADYQAIAHALGKEGIQAYLIEQAIPEIEHEANILLARLTDNQTHLTIESLRDLKNGNTKETLDIHISDAIGIRPYELFSGGEAFRIDFALRVAISKLLARRAGTRLQALIIDEGFGSQDEEGLSHIMDVLYKIQDDFAKIIIVSHLSSMKDQFPIHFVVHKGPNGSELRVIEQG